VTVQKKYVALMLLTAYRAAGLRVNMLKDNIEMDRKEMAPMIAQSENILINISCLKIIIILNDIWYKRRIS
jgi:hypothetical protein